MPRIENQKHGKLTKDEFQQLASLVLKAGYVVQIKHERPNGKQSGAFVPHVEFSEKT